MTTLHAPANPWPTLVFALAAAIVWAGVKVRNRLRRARDRVRDEHERLTEWLPAIRDEPRVAARFDQSTGRIVLPPELVGSGGRHRGLTSR